MNVLAAILSISLALTPQPKCLLERYYSAYNETYFQNRLTKDVRVSFAKLNPDIMGSTHCEGTWCEIKISDRYIGESPIYLTTLLHEQCHVLTWGEFDGHGPKWHACMRMLMNEGAFDELL